MRSSARLLLASLGSAALLGLTQAACSSFSAAGAADADAATDSSAPSASADAAVGADPGADSADAAVDAAHFCSSHADAMLCADFDEGDSVGQHFSKVSQGLTVADGGAASSAGALHVASPPAGFASFDLPTVPTAASKESLSFAFDLASIDTAALGESGYNFAGIVSAGAGCSFNLQLEGNTARLAVTPTGAAFDPYPLDNVPQAGKWTTIEIDLTQMNNFVAVTVLFDGAPTALNAQQTACPTLPSNSSVGYAYVGFNDLGSTLDAEARFDNVLYEQQ